MKAGRVGWGGVGQWSKGHRTSHSTLRQGEALEHLMTTPQPLISVITWLPPAAQAQTRTLREDLARCRDAVPVQDAELAGPRRAAAWRRCHRRRRQHDAVLRLDVRGCVCPSHRPASCLRHRWCNKTIAHSSRAGLATPRPSTLPGRQVDLTRPHPQAAPAVPYLTCVRLAYFFRLVPYLRSTMQRPNPRSRLARFITMASSISYLPGEAGRLVWVSSNPSMQGGMRLPWQGNTTGVTASARHRSTSFHVCHVPCVIMQRVVLTPSRT